MAGDLTAVIRPNTSGKTALLQALGMMFRVAPAARGAESAGSAGKRQPPMPKWQGDFMTKCRFRTARFEISALVVRIPTQIFPGKSNRIEVAYFFVSLRPSPIDWSHILASPHRREIETEPAKFCAIGENGKSADRHHVMPSRDRGIAGKLYPAIWTTGVQTFQDQ
jgi:hypothetical protein